MAGNDVRQDKIYKYPIVTNSYNPENFYAGAYRIRRPEKSGPNLIGSMFFIALLCIAAISLAANIYFF